MAFRAGELSSEDDKYWVKNSSNNHENRIIKIQYYAETFGMMYERKIKFWVFGLIFSIQLNGQNQKNNEYYNSFGEELKINEDSTFEFSWHFDLMKSWTNGIWEKNNDTIILKPILVYDTLKVENALQKDSIILSPDKNSGILSMSEFAQKQGFSTFQNSRIPPSKLFIKKGKLIPITDDGKLKRKKVKRLWTRKKFRPWFYLKKS